MLEPVWTRTGDAPPELSVLMPVRNTAGMVGDAVSSVLGQRGCVAEILVSDDGSDDGTLDVVLGAVRADRGPHTVTVLRTTRRLGIDHVGTLARASAGPLLVQAHGDDVSLPGRLATLRDLHRRTGASLITSSVRWEKAGAVVDEPVPAGYADGWVPLNALVAVNPGIFAGARYAIGRAVFERFPPLTSAYLPIGHDVVQPFRAALLGGAWFCTQRLLRCGCHDGQWTYRLWDRRFPAAANFGFLLNRLGAMRAMAKDLDHAAATALLPDDRIAAARAVVDGAASAAFNELLRYREELRRMGREPLWVTEEELARANHGAKHDDSREAAGDTEG
ncbi:MAG TPA: glycosyltransferase family A protein [Azospirillum sp.]